MQHMLKALGLAKGMGLVIGLVLMAGTASADEPTAMVEDISSDRDDVQMLDFLWQGQTIELGAEETLSVGYFMGCATETITGGTVTIGNLKSEVSGGSVETAYVDCDDQVVHLSSAQTQAAGTVVFRPGEPCDALVPDAVLYHVSPLVKLSDPAGELAYVNACEAGEGNWQTVATDNGMADFAEGGIALQPNTAYLFRAGDRTVTILISKLAETGAPGALISRYLPL